MAKFIASAGFVGYIPFAQGTFGSLCGLVLFLLLPGHLFAGNLTAVALCLAGVCVTFYFLGVWSAGVCESVWGHDPGRVVIDEVVGMLVTLFFVPLTAITVLPGFLLFMAFDIFKPQPVRWTDKNLPGGWGVMTDDVIAGVCANICLQIGMCMFKMF